MRRVLRYTVCLLLLWASPGIGQTVPIIAHTTDGSTIPAGSFPISPDATAKVVFSVFANDRAGNASLWIATVLALRVGTGNVQISLVSKDIRKIGSGPGNMAFVADADQIRIDITGEPATTVDWGIAGLIEQML